MRTQKPGPNRRIGLAAVVSPGPWYITRRKGGTRQATSYSAKQTRGTVVTLLFSGFGMSGGARDDLLAQLLGKEEDFFVPATPD